VCVYVCVCVCVREREREREREQIRRNHCTYEQYKTDSEINLLLSFVDLFWPYNTKQTARKADRKTFILLLSLVGLFWPYNKSLLTLVRTPIYQMSTNKNKGDTQRRTPKRERHTDTHHLRCSLCKLALPIFAITTKKQEQTETHTDRGSIRERERDAQTEDERKKERERERERKREREKERERKRERERESETLCS
jgi:hypothetical protein